MGYQIQYDPMTSINARANMRQHDGQLTAVVAVELWDIINGNLEDFNDTLEEKLLEYGILSDINFEVVGSGLGNEVHIRVTADVEFPYIMTIDITEED